MKSIMRINCYDTVIELLLCLFATTRPKNLFTSLSSMRWVHWIPVDYRQNILRQESENLYKIEGKSNFQLKYQKKNWLI